MCRGVALNMTDKQKGMITECLTESKIKSVWKIPADKLSVSSILCIIIIFLILIICIKMSSLILQCFGVCILKKKELVSSKYG